MKNISWELLKKQKETLNDVITEYENKNMTRTVDHLTGILYLIDSIQDEAVDSGNFTELEVFGFKK
jgi:hypothetical protein